MTDYKWEIKQRRKQRELFLNYRNNPTGDGNMTQIESLKLPAMSSEVLQSVPIHFFSINMNNQKCDGPI